MANPATLTINELTADAAITQPAGDSIDTNGTVPIALGSKMGRVIIEVINTDDAALTFKVLAGDQPPAFRAGIGDLSVALAATGSPTDKRIVGPFDSSRFAQDDGKLNVSFTAATGAPAATVRVYRLPVL